MYIRIFKIFSLNGRRTFNPPIYKRLSERHRRRKIKTQVCNMLKEVVEENFNSDTADLTLTSPAPSTNNILTKGHTATLLMNEETLLPILSVVPYPVASGVNIRANQNHCEQDDILQKINASSDAKFFLRNWGKTFNISLCAMNVLLKWFKKTLSTTIYPEIPEHFSQHHEN